MSEKGERVSVGVHMALVHRDVACILIDRSVSRSISSARDSKGILRDQVQDSRHMIPDTHRERTSDSQLVLHPSLDLGLLKDLCPPLALLVQILERVYILPFQVRIQVGEFCFISDARAYACDAASLSSPPSQMTRLNPDSRP